MNHFIFSDGIIRKMAHNDGVFFTSKKDKHPSP